MPSKISIIISLDDLINYVKPLSEKYNIYFYIEQRDETNGLFCTEVDRNENGDLEFEKDENYLGFFFSSEKLETNLLPNFYDECIFEYAIEGKGGRENKDELELVQLRLIAKKPDKVIKSFFNAINNKLKKDEDFDLGIYTSKKTFYKNIFYAKKEMNNKTIWFDFNKKLNQIVFEKP